MIQLYILHFEIMENIELFFSCFLEKYVEYCFYLNVDYWRKLLYYSL
jgi:hypothetical protein